MSGLIGHSLCAVLGLKAAAKKMLPLTGVVQRHLASYVAGAYLGSDIQTMPEAVCVDTGRDVGYGTVPLERSPITGGAVRQFRLPTADGPLSARAVHERFYGRAHLVFGWTQKDQPLRVPWDHLPEYFAAVIDDIGTEERALAYTLGWIVHVVSDSLIKGVQPGIELDLLDGRYTTRNRPVQDLIAFHEIGITELGVNWPVLFADLAATPVEDIQPHYMRCAKVRGKLAALFPDGWQPGSEAALRAVLAENRRWVKHHAEDVLADMALRDGECSQKLRVISGLNYAAMKGVAAKAGFRKMHDTMADHIVVMFEATQQRSERLAALPDIDVLSWDEITQRCARIFAPPQEQPGR